MYYNSQQGGSEFSPVVANRTVLKSLSRVEVVICKWTKPLKNQYFKIILTDVHMTKCSSCNKVAYIAFQAIYYHSTILLNVTD